MNSSSHNTLVPSASQDLRSDVSTGSPSTKTTKRKLDDAFQSLDDALGSDAIAERPTKKAHVTRSLYSTLAKYGIKTRDSKLKNIPTKNDTLAKSTPRLTAILARAASHTRKAIPFTFSAPTPSNCSSQESTLEYRPSSVTSFISRLATFKLATYANKPSAIDAVAASKCGWINDGKNRLVCRICNVSWVVAGREGMNRDAANTLIEKQKVYLVEMHKDGCPWKTRQCDASIYRIPLQSPSATARGIKANAMALESVLKDVEIKHPLTTTQTQAFRKILAALPPMPSVLEDPQNERPALDSRPSQTAQIEPSETAALTSLFGWLLTLPNLEHPRPTPLSRAASVSSSRASTPTPGPPRPLIRMGAMTPKRDTSLLHCALCQRRVGLWAFGPSAQSYVPGRVEQTTTPNASSVAGSSSLRPPPVSPQRQFDLLREHRSYCPYVVRSTVVPSLPVPAKPISTSNGHSRSTSTASVNGQNSAALEGWRAVLAVVLRYGMGQRHQMGSRGAAEMSASEASEARPGVESSDELDGVEAMVAGVKTRGDKELLRYVKGLLS